MININYLSAVYFPRIFLPDFSKVCFPPCHSPLLSPDCLSMSCTVMPCLTKTSPKRSSKGLPKISGVKNFVSWDFWGWVLLLSCFTHFKHLLTRNNCDSSSKLAKAHCHHVPAHMCCAETHMGKHICVNKIAHIFKEFKLSSDNTFYAQKCLIS